MCVCLNACECVRILIWMMPGSRINNFFFFLFFLRDYLKGTFLRDYTVSLLVKDYCGRQRKILPALSAAKITQTDDNA